MKNLALLGAVLAAAMAVPAAATQTIYTVSGSFAGVSQSANASFNTDLTFTAVGNPAQQQNYPFFSLIPLTSLTVSSSTASATLDPGLFIGINPDFSLAFFVKVIDLPTNQFSFPLVFASPSFSTTAGLAGGSTAPVTFFESQTFNTSRGDLTVFASSPLTFTAATVPEPAAWTLMVVGFAMTGFGVRSRARRITSLTA